MKKEKKRFSLNAYRDFCLDYMNEANTETTIEPINNTLVQDMRAKLKKKTDLYKCKDEILDLGKRYNVKFENMFDKDEKEDKIEMVITNFSELSVEREIFQFIQKIDELEKKYGSSVIVKYDLNPLDKNHTIELKIK